MSLLVPSPSPYQFVDYVVVIYFAPPCAKFPIARVPVPDGMNICSGVGNEPVLIHLMGGDVANRKEFVIVTQHASSFKLHESQRYFDVPENAYHILLPRLASFFVKYFHPIVLSNSCLGTNCSSTFRYLRNSLGLQSAVLMDVGHTPHLSSHLRLLLMFCETRRDRELYEYNEAVQQKKLLAAKEEEENKNGGEEMNARSPSNTTNATVIKNNNTD